MSTRAQPHATLLLSVHSTAHGGSERCAVAEAEHLSPSYSLIAAAPAGPLLDDLARHATIVDGPPLLPTWGDTPRRWAVQLARTLVDTIRLARVIQREGVDAVVCNSSVALSPVLAARLTRRPALVHLRDSPNSRLARPLVRLEARLATTVVAVSTGLAALCGEKPRARVLRIADGIPIPPVQSRPPFRDPLQLGVVGAVDRGKGQDVAVRAVAELLGLGIEAELHLVGREQDTAFAAELRSAALDCGVADRVHFHGEQRDLEQFYAAFDVLLLASRREAFGLVVLEALARGLPVVAARVGSVPELLLGGRAGMIVEPGDPAALAAGVVQLRNDPELLQSLTSRGRSHVAENYDVKRALRLGAAEIARLIGDDGSLARGDQAPSRLPSDQLAERELLSGP
jgi:glycosyltransferase involved in cell wall biosynthesis